MILGVIPVFCQEKPTDSSTTKINYCEIVVTSDLGKMKIKIEIDFGQNKNYPPDNLYKDPSTGKPMVFNTIVDALNLMGKDGWEFVQEYTEGDRQIGVIYHFLLKKMTNILEKRDSVQK
jgi:hypothetical protein